MTSNASGSASSSESAHGSFEDLSIRWLRWLNRRGKVLPSSEEMARAAAGKFQVAKRRAQSAKRQAQSARRVAERERKRAEAAERL